MVPETNRHRTWEWLARHLLSLWMVYLLSKMLDFIHASDSELASAQGGETLSTVEPIDLPTKSKGMPHGHPKGPAKVWIRENPSMTTDIFASSLIIWFPLKLVKFKDSCLINRVILTPRDHPLIIPKWGRLYFFGGWFMCIWGGEVG